MSTLVSLFVKEPLNAVVTALCIAVVSLFVYEREHSIVDKELQVKVADAVDLKRVVIQIRDSLIRVEESVKHQGQEIERIRRRNEN